MSYIKEDILERLIQCFRLGDGMGFIKLFDLISEQRLDINYKQIKDLKDKIGSLLATVLQNSIQTSDFSLFFEILIIVNKFNLFKNIEIEEDLKSNSFDDSETLILDNLNNLFGNFNSNFLNFIKFELPGYILKLLAQIAPPYLENIYDKERIEEVRNYVEYHFYLYGFRVRKVGLFDTYLKNYGVKREPYEEGYSSLKVKGGPSIISSRFFFEFYDAIQETHIIREDVFNEIVKKYKKERVIYGYPLISMVISGGIGPQGKGFAYLTPKNEIIEVCSDASQNKAYIIEFKKFLKSIFLSKLEEKLQEENIVEDLLIEILNTLDSLIEVDIVSTRHINLIWDKVEEYLIKKIKNLEITDTEEFFSFLKKSIYNILVPVKIEDQFKTRMNLIIENKLEPTDISKLVSLGSISHYDILCQRRFFINLLNNMLAIHLK